MAYVSMCHFLQKIVENWDKETVGHSLSKIAISSFTSFQMAFECYVISTKEPFIVVYLLF